MRNKASWPILGVASASQFFGQLHQVALAVVAVEITNEFHLDATSFGFLASLYFYSYAVTQLPAGFLADRIGLGKILFLSTVCVSLGTMGFSFSDTFLTAAAARLVIGLGSSVVWVAGPKLFVASFEARRFTSSVGFFIGVGNLGAVAGGLPFALLVGTLGWRSAYIVVGMASLAVALAIALLVREPRHKLAVVKVPTSDVQVSFLSLIRESIRRILRESQFWLLAIVFFVSVGPQVVLQGVWGVQYLVDSYFIEKSASASTVTIIAVGYAIGAPLWGFISDLRLCKRKLLLVFGSVLSAIVWLPLLMPPMVGSVPILSCLFFLLGVAFSSRTLGFSIVKDAFAPHVSGVVLASLTSVGLLAAMLYPPISGFMLDLVSPSGQAGIYSSHGFQLILGFCFVGILFGAGASLLVKERMTSRFMSE